MHLLFPYLCKLTDHQRVLLVFAYTALWSAHCPALSLVATRSRLHLPTCVVTDTGVVFSKAEQLLLPSPLKNDSTLSPGHFVRWIFTPAPYKRLILSFICTTGSCVVTLPTELSAIRLPRDIQHSSETFSPYAGGTHTVPGTSVSF